ncbi:MAG: GGDEF domain-containing protein [Candidatus Thiodiazotropha sp. (ex Gloverina cf. vestifex)]|nr:GGDEF domain-containing protein [Candidatus Thiodiazotropha sp. (ex Gloverina cf. vestifex)]
MKELLRHEEQKSERYANNVRLLFTFLYFAVAFGIQNELPAHSFQAIIVASLMNLFYAIAVYFILKNQHPPTWIKYPSISIDIILLSVVIYSFGTFRSFKTEAFLLYYLWIGLSTLRFSPRLTLAAGLLSIGAYLIMTFAAIDSQSITLGTITDEFTSERVSAINIVLRLVFLSAFIALAVYIANVFRIVASRALTKQLLQARHDRVSETLDKLRATQKQLANKNRELATLSEIDPLTQSYNRRKIDQFMSEALENADPPLSQVALILLDIDRFKSYNDQYGHQVGDRIIQTVAEVLRKTIRGNDNIGHWGGEEFIVVCRETDIEAAMTLADRLKASIEFSEVETDERVTCSFGVTTYREGDTADSLLKRADEALYISKEQGRNQVTFVA